MKSGVAYFGVRNADLARRDIRRIKEAGFSHILHTWSEEDLQYYPQTMKELISISVAERLAVYVNPWGVGRIFGGEAYTELAARNPAMAQVSLDGYRLVASCPNNPAFREYIFNWIDIVCDSEVETIFWDEPHFYFEKKNPNLRACKCQHCAAIYKDETGENIPDFHNEKFEAFRQKSLVNFLAAVTERVHKNGKRNSVCLLPPWFPAGLKNWDEVAALPFVDEIGSDPYWEKGDSLESVRKNYGEVSKRIFDLAKTYNREAQMWIKNYHIESGTENFIREATEISANAGIKNIFAWSYLGSKYMDCLRSDKPELVWETQIKANSVVKAREYGHL